MGPKLYVVRINICALSFVSVSGHYREPLFQRRSVSLVLTMNIVSPLHGSISRVSVPPSGRVASNVGLGPSRESDQTECLLTNDLALYRSQTSVSQRNPFNPLEIRLRPIP